MAWTFLPTPRVELHSATDSYEADNDSPIQAMEENPATIPQEAGSRASCFAFFALAVLVKTLAVASCSLGPAAVPKSSELQVCSDVVDIVGS